MLRQILNRTLGPSLSGRLIDMIQGRNISAQAHYPDSVGFQESYAMVSRLGVARTILQYYPMRCWEKEPYVSFRTKAATSTWRSLVDKLQAYNKLSRADWLSRIGEYGVLFLGFNDGKSADQPVKRATDLLYMQPYHQGSVTIVSYITDTKSEYYGMPEYYSLQSNRDAGGLTQRVHWTRILHICDKREESDYIGVPYLRPVYNRMLDLDKILASAGEQFYQGAFGGWSFLLDNDVELDEDMLSNMRKQIKDYVDGMQPYMQLQGVKPFAMRNEPKSPKLHVDVINMFIAAYSRIPLRILYGSERGELASTTDTDNCNAVVSQRRTNYVVPMILEPLITRLQMVGILPDVSYEAGWDRYCLATEEEMITIADKKLDVITKYITSGASEWYPVEDFFVDVLHYSQDQANEINKKIMEGTDAGNDQQQTEA